MGGRARRLLVGLRDVWVAVGLTLVLLAMGEVAARVVQKARARTWADPRARADSYPAEPWVKEFFDETRRSSRVRWEPYAYWRRTPFAGRYINIDERGLRRTWNPPATGSGARRPRIFVFGASEVWGSGVRDDHTLPSELSRSLNDAGVAAEVVNFGETGHVSTQSVVTLLRELQRGNVPDVVVYFGGGSDGLSAFATGAAGIPLGESRRRREFNILRHARRLVPEALRLIAARSAMVRLLGVQLDAPRSRKEPEVAPDRLAEMTLHALDANIAAIDGLARTYGFRTSYFWQPCLLSKPHQTPYEAQQAAAAAGLPYLSELYARARREWQGRDPREFTYLGDLFLETREPRFIDYTHVGETGNREIGAAIGRQLIECERLALREVPAL